jgi:hypothetical protein
MKGTAPQKGWPVPETQTPTPVPKARPAAKTISRITLALLDEYSELRGRGYDPYDTHSGTQRLDVWRRKPKRD